MTQEIKLPEMDAIWNDSEHGDVPLGYTADTMRRLIEEAAAQADYRKALDRITDLECELGQALSQLAAAQADAKRYQWLRASPDFLGWQPETRG